MAKITYEDKEFLNKNESIADKNKVSDTNLNEIKEVVNGNDDKIGDLSDLNTTNKDSLVSAINSLFPNNIITETGSNSNGSWRKYANGDMECWFIQQVSVAINAQWGSLYVGTASLHNFPQTFTEIPVTQISFAPNGNQALIGRTSDNSLTRTNPGKIALFRGNVNSSANYKIHVYAKGKWK